MALDFYDHILKSSICSVSYTHLWVGQFKSQRFQCLFLLGCYVSVLVLAVEYMTFVDMRCAFIQMQCPVQHMNMVAILGFERLDEMCIRDRRYI